MGRIRPASRRRALALAACLTGLLAFPALAVGDLLPGAPAPVNNATGAVGGVTNSVGGTVGGIRNSVGGTVGGVTGRVGGAVGGPVGGTVGGVGGSVGRTISGSGGGGGGGGGGGTNGNGGGSNSGTSGGGTSGGGGGGGNGGLTLTPGGGAAGGAGAAAAGGPGGAAARRAAARRAARNALRVNGTRAADKTSGGSGGGGAGPLRQIIQVIPGWLWAIIAGLAALAGVFFFRSWIERRRARRLEVQRAELERHREELLSDVGVLQSALLPEVPSKIRSLEASVAYRPADGPAAGGDFYDVFEMEGDRVAIIVGDVCGHGRQALAVTALMRYSLRAYLQAGGGEPRVALQIAARALENEQHAELTTVVLAVYDAREGTLTYACAGHEPPILLGAPAHKPVTTGSSPPIGAGFDTGLRQTQVPLPPGSMACFFTDGLVEARLGDGLLGRKRLAELAKELGEEGCAGDLLARIAERADRATDDMAACIVRPAPEAVAPDGPRVEELELDGTPGEEKRARGFLAACGMPDSSMDATLRSARTKVGEFGGAVLRVRLEDGRGSTEVVPKQPTVMLGLNGSGVEHTARASSPA